MCYLRSMEYTYCFVCPRLCHVRSKLRRGTDRFCRDEFTAHLCFITRQRMAADEQACREANERAEREEEAEAEEARNGGRGRGRRRRRRRERRVPEVTVESNENGRCDACEAVASGGGMGQGWCRIIRGGGGIMGGGWIMGLGGLGLEYGGGG